MTGEPLRCIIRKHYSPALQKRLSCAAREHREAQAIIETLRFADHITRQGASLGGEGRYGRRCPIYMGRGMYKERPFQTQVLIAVDGFSSLITCGFANLPRETGSLHIFRIDFLNMELSGWRRHFKIPHRGITQSGIDDLKSLLLGVSIQARPWTSLAEWMKVHQPIQPECIEYGIKYSLLLLTRGPIQTLFTYRQGHK